MDFVKLIIYLNDGVTQVKISEDLSYNISNAVKNKLEDELRNYFHNLTDVISGEEFDIDLDDVQGFECTLGR